MFVATNPSAMKLQSSKSTYEIVWKIRPDDAPTYDSVSSEKEVLQCKNWPLRTSSLCHCCCHGFSTVPVPLPQAYDRVRRIYYCKGLFCSWNCAKSYNLHNTALNGRGDRNAYISLLAYRLWVKYKVEPPSAVRLSQLDRYSRYNIRPSRPKECLRAFGGDVDIKDYRNGFFGIVPPEEAVVGKPFLQIRDKIAQETTVLPFVNLSANSRPASLAANHAPSKPTNTHRNPFMAPTGVANGVVLHNTANEFCSRLNRATDNHDTMLKRKREDAGKNTLMTSMGIVIEKRKK